MKYKDLPTDIVKYVNNRIIRCSGLFLILECVSIVFCILTWNYFATKTNVGFHLCVLFVICLIPFLISKFPKDLIDKSWSGEVVKVFVEEEKGINHTSVGLGHPYVKHVIYLDIKKDNSKKIKCIAAQEFGIRQQIGFPVPNEGDVTKHLNDYSIGDRVYHFYGLKHYYFVKKNQEMVKCVVCGSENKKDRDSCLNCGHSVLKSL